jgi:hypothetical protein
MCAMANSLNAKLELLRRGNTHLATFHDKKVPTHSAALVPTQSTALAPTTPTASAPTQSTAVASEDHEDYGVYMHQGDVNRAYRNLLSCQLVQWQSGLYLYVIRARPDGPCYLQSS